MHPVSEFNFMKVIAFNLQCPVLIAGFQKSNPLLQLMMLLGCE